MSVLRALVSCLAVVVLATGCTPSPQRAEAGADWFRCDVVAVASPRQLRQRRDGRRAGDGRRDVCDRRAGNEGVPPGGVRCRARVAGGQRYGICWVPA